MGKQDLLLACTNVADGVVNRLVVPNSMVRLAAATIHYMSTEYK